MDADVLSTRLERDDATPTVAAFPDGSVDTFYRVSAGGQRVDTREAFAERVAAGSTDVFSLDRRFVEPGGHAINLGGQALRLGNACASWYVATGASGTAGELAGFLRERG